jgi:hypothetical protein
MLLESTLTRRLPERFSCHFSNCKRESKGCQCWMKTKAESSLYRVSFSAGPLSKGRIGQFFTTQASSTIGCV